MAAKLRSECRGLRALSALIAASSTLGFPSLAYADGVLPLGSSIHDTVFPVTNTYYSIATPVDGALSLMLTPPTERNILLGFTAPDKTLGTHGDSWGAEYSVSVTHLKAGDYYALLYLYGFETDDPAGVTLSATFEPAPLTVDAEPNDEFDAALPLESGVPVTGHLGYDGFTEDNGYDADDYYAIEVLDGGSLDATLQMAAADANNALQLYDANQALVESQDITLPADEVTIHRDGLVAGIYFLKTHQYGFGCGAYTLTATVSDPTGGPDGDVVLPLGTPLDDVIAAATDEYYSVTTPVDGALTLTVVPPEGRNVLLGFATPDKTLKTHGDSWGAEYSVAVGNLRAGSYYAKLFTYGFTSDPPVSVTLSATFEPAPLTADAEPNDGMAEALALASGAQVSGHLGYDGFTSEAAYDEADYYAVVVAEGGSIEATLRMAAASANNALQLQDAKGAVLGSQDISRPADRVTLRRDDLAGGTYYVKVHQYGFGYGAYYLAADVSAPAVGPDSEGTGGASSSDSTGNAASRQDGLGDAGAASPDDGGKAATAGSASGSNDDDDTVRDTGAAGSADSGQAKKEGSTQPVADDSAQTSTSRAGSGCHVHATRGRDGHAPALFTVLAFVGIALARRRRTGRA